MVGPHVIPDDLRAAVRSLCRDALDGKLSMREYETRWPKQADADPFLTIVDEDLIEAVVHLPTGLISRHIDWAGWHTSEEYTTLLLDDLLLGAAGSSEELLAFRREHLNREMGEQELRDLIEERFGTPRRA
ncbi:MAG: hypothetical protein NVS4B3_27220 [Gemmatimonadaceae bacterium]